MNTNNREFFLSRFTERSGVDGLVFFILILIYLFQMDPHPGFHDSLAYLSDSVDGYHFQSNATNHFLYNNLLHTLVLFLQFISPIVILGVFSVVFSILTLLRMYELMRILGKSQTVSLACVGIFAFSFTWWQQTEIIEVYTFNAFLFLSFFRQVLVDLLEGKRNNTGMAALFLCLGLLTHIQNILSIPFFLIYIFSGDGISMSKRVRNAAFGLSGLFILFIPAIVFHLNSVSSIFFDNNFEGNVTSLSLAGIGKGLALACGFFLYNFHLFALFVLHGLILLWKTNKKIWLFLFALFLPYFSFGVKFNVTDNHVFFLAAWLVLLVPVSYSLDFWFQKFRSMVSIVLLSSFLITPLIYYTAAEAGEQLPQLAEYAKEKEYKGGVAHLLWPGKRYAPDPLELAMKICPADSCPEVEWDIRSAKNYLRIMKR